MYKLFTSKKLVEVQQKLDNHCDKAKEATKEVLGKWSDEREALRDNLKAAAARIAEQEQSIQVLKQDLAGLKFNAAKKDEAIEKMEKELSVGKHSRILIENKVMKIFFHRNDQFQQEIGNSSSK